MSTTIIQNNNADLQAILDSINALPEESSGVELPALTNEGTASDLVSGKELIDQEGNVITGTNPYELNATNAEVEEQADLIEQISALIDTKAHFNTIYIGAAEPTADIGINGDIYIVRSEA